MGRQFDSFGNLKNWWHNETLEKYMEKSKCFIKQYSKYKINEKHIDGINSLGENIADNGGFKVAYRTYKKYIKDKIEDEIDELNKLETNYTQDQLFWIASAQTWCNKRRDGNVFFFWSRVSQANQLINYRKYSCYD